MSIGPRNPRIDMIRGISILLVLFHHFNIPYHLNDTTLARLFGWDAVHAVARNGNYGVTMFFVISGFLITSNAQARWGALSKIDASVFYRLRFARIVPALLLLLTIVNVLAVSGVTIFQNHPEAGPPVSLWLVNFACLTFWMNMLMATPAGWVNYALGVLWSLSIEEVFYLSFPIACLVLKRPLALAAFWSLFIVIGPIWRGLHQDNEAQFLYSYFASFDGIAIGCCTALLAKRMSMRGLTATILQTVTVAAMTFLYLYRSIGQTNVLGVTAMAFGTALLLLAAHHRPSSPLLDYTPVPAAVGWFGQLSYELYLFHLIVLGAIRTIVPPQLVVGDKKLLLLMAFLVISALLSAGIARLYAEPLNRIIRGHLVRSSVVAAE